ncbi:MULTISPECIES: cation diffusion facilitator family transporter [Peptoniphilus]|jgi:cation diffusion facilitator family transporter|uniref:cation diffusion facilitator family transporter n=1 Tax=Peptoniphilus TaxID=162289 RepID=UPI0002888CEF|nr:MULTISPECIES: cation diffusion facilitator family transporter [Peptoniphilus]MBS6610505.1 cation transporter [Peptoniphilus harei]MDU1954892.1 cation diffusion facilitator family transporter [Peptoniphilus lacydonensis]MDU2114737.1 cation diffusion facilitator family transporter [Peptoniphilus lacydonensis]MDU5274301.1 cation diffusion facilitator family transporter [Peptoniphilus lacydonensis]MDU5377470.1 cation diffusion facilitator family transporter [Peptoniphilus lacydonensis]
MFWKLILKRGQNSYGYDRVKISKETSFLGLISNILVALLKIILYIFTGSISILSDAVNNITDCVSSIISIFGIKLASKPKDKNHPYGHGRLEYLISLVVSGIVLSVGFQFLRSSVSRIIHPEKIFYPKYTIVILIISVIVKFWQASLYSHIADAIDSVTIKAQEKDSLSDTLITLVVIISIIIEKFTEKILDGYVGALVALFILYTALSLIYETISIILGRGLSEETKHEIKSKVSNYEGISNVHNIMVTDFGPENIIVLIDAALDYNLTLEEAHNIVDKVEREVSRLLGIKLVIHADPLGSSSAIIKSVSEDLKKIIRKSLNIYSFHDIVLEDNKIYIDIDYNADSIVTSEEKDALKDGLEEKLKSLYKDYDFEIKLNSIF